VAELGLTQRRACRLVGISRSGARYRRRGVDPPGLRDRLRSLAAERRRYGYRRLWVLLRREGFQVNHKRVYRMYREEGLMVQRRKRKRMCGSTRVATSMPSRGNQRWSMDFVADSLVNGRRIRVLTVVDDFTRECLATEVDTSLPGLRVARVLDQLGAVRGLPEGITVDNGPEFTGRALDAWAYQHRVQLNFIEPGKPVQNAYIESFNGKLRDECLNEHWFSNLGHARTTVEAWRDDYNGVRPHSALGNLTPDQFLQQIRGQTPAGLSQ
jgi:putative transposase